MTPKSEYYKKRYKTIILRFSYEHDKTIIEELEKRENITNYMRQLLNREFKK